MDQPPRRRPLGFVRHAFISPPRMVFLTSEQLNLIWSGSLVSWIPDSNLQQDSGFLVLDSGFQSPGFRIPEAKNSWIPQSGFPYMGRNCQLLHNILHHFVRGLQSVTLSGCSCPPRLMLLTVSRGLECQMVFTVSPRRWTGAAFVLGKYRLSMPQASP